MPIHPDMQKMFNQHDQLVEQGKRLITNFRALVWFRIPGLGLSRPRYWRFISDLLADFVESCDVRNLNEVIYMRIRVCDRLNEEGGIGPIHVDGHFISHCKMYICDGAKESRLHNPMYRLKTWRGVMFRDHMDTNPEYNTAKVFLVANALEKFLKANKIRFERINSKK